MKFAICCLAIIGCVNAQFSATAQTAIVKAHNDLRSAIAKGTYDAAGTIEPPAANMRKMVKFFYRKIGKHNIMRNFRNGTQPLLPLLRSMPIYAQMTTLATQILERISIGHGPHLLQQVLINS